MQRNRGKQQNETRDLFKKIRDTKGTFHAKMGPIKNRNGMDLTEAEDIKKRWQEYWSGANLDPRRQHIEKQRHYFADNSLSSQNWFFQ